MTTMAAFAVAPRSATNCPRNSLSCASSTAIALISLVAGRGPGVPGPLRLHRGLRRTAAASVRLPGPGPGGHVASPEKYPASWVTAPSAGLGQQARHVLLDRARRQEHPLRDLAVAQAAARRRLEDIGFAVGHAQRTQPPGQLHAPPAQLPAAPAPRRRRSRPRHAAASRSSPRAGEVGGGLAQPAATGSPQPSASAASAASRRAYWLVPGRPAGPSAASAAAKAASASP